MGNFDNYITLKIAHTQIFVILHTSDLKDWPTANQLLFRVRIYRTKQFPCRIVFIIYILRHSSFRQPFYFKSKNIQNDKQNEAAAY